MDRLKRFARGLLMMAAGVLVGLGVVKVVQWAKAEPQKEACACESGALCEGPRGGIYCITAGGNKRYF